MVANSKLKPVALAGHVKTTFVPERKMVSRGAPGNVTERPNTVPRFAVPSALVVPYRVLPDKTNPARGTPPSVFVKVTGSGSVKLYRFVKSEPSVLMANTVPTPPTPPPFAVP